MTASLLLALAGGCVQPCSGAGCSDLYPAAALRLLPGAALVGDLAPLDLPAAVSGTAADGNRWSLDARTGTVLVGVADAGEVWSYDPVALAEAGGPAGRLTWPSPGDDFGLGLARWPQADGSARLLVGAPLASGGPGLDGAGAVLVYEGGDGFSGAQDAGTPLRRVEGAAPEARFGTRVDTCGDLDRDGQDDWAAWAPWGSDPDALAGEVRLWLSTADPGGDTVAATALRTLVGGDAEGFGAGVVCRESLDADTVPDLVIGAPGADRDVAADVVDPGGTVSIWHGGTSVGTVAAALVVRGRETGEEFGAAVATGDLDGDGSVDLLVGAPGRTADGAADDNRAGGVYVYMGRRLAAYLEGGIFLGDYEPDFEIHGIYARERLGAAVAAVDLDGDGADELLVGAPGLNPTGDTDDAQSGALYLYRWGDWPPVQDTADAEATLSEPRQYLRTGERFAVADVDGDGAAEVMWTNRVQAP